MNLFTFLITAEGSVSGPNLRLFNILLLFFSSVKSAQQQEPRSHLTVRVSRLRAWFLVQLQGTCVKTLSLHLFCIASLFSRFSAQIDATW